VIVSSSEATGLSIEYMMSQGFSGVSIPNASLKPLAEANLRDEPFSSIFVPDLSLKRRVV
jgi:hypothetical protein